MTVRNADTEHFGRILWGLSRLRVFALSHELGEVALMRSSLDIMRRISTHDIG